MTRPIIKAIPAIQIVARFITVARLVVCGREGWSGSNGMSSLRSKKPLLARARLSSVHDTVMLGGI